MAKKKVILVVSGLIIGLIGLAAFPVVSGLQYNAYREEVDDSTDKTPDEGGDEVIDTEPKVTGLNVVINDGVEYFKNGLAEPKNSDFKVQAVITSGEETFNRDISSDQFTMEVPEDFKENGGVITFIYEDVTATLEISLVDVIPVSLEIVNNPNIVTYEEGQHFDPTGMVVDALFNDGSKKNVDVLNLTIDRNIALTTDMTSFKVSFTNMDVTVELNVPIKVMSHDTFTNGELLTLDAEGYAEVFENQPISEADFKNVTVMGRYESGNYIKLSEDKFEVLNGETIPSFGEEMRITVVGKDKSDVATSLLTKVVSIKEAEQIQQSGGTSSSEDGFIYDGNQIKEEGTVGFLTNLGTNSSFVFENDSVNYTRADLTFRVASGTYQEESDQYLIDQINLGEIFKITLNGYQITTPLSLTSPMIATSIIEQATATYFDITLNDILIKGGVNDFSFEVLKDSTNLKIDYISISSFGKETDYSLGDYSLLCNINNIGEIFSKSDINIEPIKYTYYEDGDTSYMFDQSQGAVSDGEHLYICLTTNGNSHGLIVEYDIASQTIIRTGKPFPISDTAFYNETGSIFVKDENLYFLDTQKHSLLKFDLETLTNVETIPFEVKGADADNVNKNAIGIKYNSYNERYIVYLNNGSIRLYDKEWNYISTLVSYAISLNGVLQDVVTTRDYVYVFNSADGLNGARIAIYTYDGKKLSEFELNYGDRFSGQVNCQSMFEIDNKLYLGIQSFGIDRGLYLYHISFDDSLFKNIDRNTLGGYLALCASKGVEPKYEIIKPENPLTAEGEYLHIQGGDTDGMYGYYVFTDNGNRNLRLVKYSFEEEKIIAYSEPHHFLDTALWSDTYNVFYKDGKVGIVDIENHTIHFFSSQTLEYLEGETLEFNGIDSSDANAIFSIQYNPLLEKYAIYIRGARRIYFADKDGNVIEDPISCHQPSDNNLISQGIYSDGSYIYDYYSRDGYAGLIINIYDWDGNFIREIAIEGIGTGVETSKNNVQNMVYYKGSLYFAGYSFGEDIGAYINKIVFDTSILE